jgi:hypothetical protein
MAHFLLPSTRIRGAVLALSRSEREWNEFPIDPDRDAPGSAWGDSEVGMRLRYNLRPTRCVSSSPALRFESALLHPWRAGHVLPNSRQVPLRVSRISRTHTDSGRFRVRHSAILSAAQKPQCSAVETARRRSRGTDGVVDSAVVGRESRGGRLVIESSCGQQW